MSVTSAGLTRDELVRENEVLRTALDRYQTLLAVLSDIQIEIRSGTPLQQVLDQIVAAAGRILGDDAPGLFLRSQQDPETIELVAQAGLGPKLAAMTRHRRVGQGVAGTAVAEGRLVVVDDYEHFDRRLEAFTELHLTTAMAAPVHERGEVIGCLIISSFEPGRRFTRDEQDTLVLFAEHASMAIADARTVEAMSRQALHDELTGLPNRRLFSDQVRAALHRAQRRGTRPSMIFLDVDRFKTVNDSLGHGAGDELLVEVARRLESCLRASDVAARLGGDEFAVLLEDISDPLEALRVGERIAQAMRRPASVAGHQVALSASIGIAGGCPDGAELLRRADVAMYRAKALGRDRVALFEPTMQAEAQRRLALEGDLDRALRVGELVLYYQPVVELYSERPVGYEALVRWRHPTRGLLEPGEFIAVAEETGRIIELGRLVLREACREAARLRSTPPEQGRQLPWVAVNLSARQLDDGGLVADIACALEAAELPPDALVLEITETALMRDTDATLERLGALHELGVRIAIDDFGTGYSSLRYLQAFPVDLLKMAKPFVDGLDVDDDARALGSAIVALASGMRLVCIAEGVERPAQADRLRDMGCELAQGYHFATPGPVARAVYPKVPHRPEPVGTPARRR